jgi:hypothetical protein
MPARAPAARLPAMPSFLFRTLWCGAALALPLLAAAQVQCWAPQENQDAATRPVFVRQYAWAKAAEKIIAANAAFVAPPEPVRMRTTVSIGPYAPSGARLYVRAYPEITTIGNIRIWSAGCGVIPQAERVAASIGQIDIFFNDSVAPFLGGDAVPKFEGLVGGYPRYNGWVVVTKDGRLPWIPQTLADRLDAEIARRERALADWQRQMQQMKLPDAAAVQKTYTLLKQTDPAGADQYLRSTEELGQEMKRKTEHVWPLTARQLEQALADARRVRTSFGPAELAMPAVWTDHDGAGKRRLEARVRELNELDADERALVASRQQTGVAVRNLRRDRVGHLIAEAQAAYELEFLKPGPKEQAIAYKADPAFPDMSRPDKLQLITIVFSEDPRRERGPWMKAAKDGFDWRALAAMLD